MRTLLVLAFVTPTVAAAAPSFEIVDHGDAVEVIGREMTAAKLAVTPVRSRLEVPLVGAPTATKIFPPDKTVRQIELDGGSTRALSVKLGYERDDVRALAPFAKVTQVGTNLHIVFPRAIPAAGTAIKLPEPVAPAAPVEPPVATTSATAPAAAAPVEQKPTAPLSRDPMIEIKTEPAPIPAAKPAPTKAPLATKPSDGLGTRLPTLLALMFAVVGCGLWMMKRRKNPPAQHNAIQILAQKSLGGKARIVWLSAGQREMIVAVTPQQVKVLGQWRPDGAPTAAIGEAAVERAYQALPRASTVPPPAISRAATSPAVSGLLRLRERAGTVQPMPIADHVATEDTEADAAWAREIVAAMGTRR
ncbi:MAG TPA: flagellar biosynthetic protein FliO [Kofleriaceae bacterium]|nr:flagellar biosynthetic protein FliO [Kofleriaceae bacterium]